MTPEQIRQSIEIQTAAGHDMITIPAAVLIKLLEAVE